MATVCSVPKATNAAANAHAARGRAPSAAAISSPPAAERRADELQPPRPADDAERLVGPLAPERLGDRAHQREPDPAREHEQHRQRDEGDEALATELRRPEEARPGDRDRDDVELRDDVAERRPRAAAHHARARRLGRLIGRGRHRGDDDKPPSPRIMSPRPV